MALLTPEAILRQIDSLYAADYATVLAAVQAKWVATEDIELNNFEFRRISADPNTTAVIKQYPALMISMGNIVSIPAQTQMYQNLYDMEVECLYFLRGQDDHQIGIILARHIEATMDFFKENPRLGYDRETVITGLRFEPSANVIPGGGNTMVKGLRVSFNVRFMQYGA